MVKKFLCIAFERPVLEHRSCVWSSEYKESETLIESVQKQFLIFALRNLGWNCARLLPSYR